ncbi:dihydrolipoamide acetyltransferase family protein [Humidisolicoccus flavus]|uniref:dihydrolipoamide acetyltransferase family protein n=1 Tax=Humidisolicoccus flavus TaxID=3111414 RepID=UPI0032541DA5
MTTFKLPDLGEGLTESEIVQWKVAEGDTVELNQILAEVETAKAIVELPSPYAGVIRKLHAQAGETVDVGSPLIEYDLEGADVADDQAARSAADKDAAGTGSQDAEQSEDVAASKTATPERQSVLVGYGPKITGTQRPKRSQRTFSVIPFDRSTHGGPEGATEYGARITPPLRQYAKHLGVSQRRLEDAARSGVLNRDVVLRLSRNDSSSAESAASSSGESTRIRVQGLRKHTAKAMTDSAFTAPHATVSSQVDVTESLALVAQAAASKQQVSFLSLVSRAILAACKAVPAANSRFDAEAGEIELFSSVNLGIAVATDKGLVVPSVDAAEHLSASELTEQIAAVATKARDGNSSASELTRSTLTVTNIGVFGVDQGFPILNPGETVIVAVGAIRKMPWEHNGGIELRDVCTISVAFDHRVLDGAEGAQFLRTVHRLLEHPATALLG